MTASRAAKILTDCLCLLVLRTSITIHEAAAIAKRMTTITEAVCNTWS